MAIRYHDERRLTSGNHCPNVGFEIQEKAVTISNDPPPFEAHSMNIEDLLSQAQDYLDGEPISSQGQADDVGRLLDLIRQAQKAADTQRAAEKKPHDDAAKAVQAIWKPLLDRCETATSIAKKALTPWLTKLAEEQLAAVQKAREEAMVKQEAALIAQRAAQASNDLNAAEKAKAATKIAEAAQREAVKAEKATSNAAGGARAIGLRTSYRAEVIDYTAFARWAWTNMQEDLFAALDGMARSLATSPREIPGVTIHVERNAA